VVTDAMPVAIRAAGGALEVEFAYTRTGANGLEKTGAGLTLPADQVFKAIGQTLHGQPAALALAGGKIAVDAEGRTSLPDVWAGGDCAAGGEDLTVTAVAQGRDAAMSIHAALVGR
jgi:glutamate synthase (NADPH/NADH) small chain